MFRRVYNVYNETPMKGKIMFDPNEIKNMTKEELAYHNKILIKQVFTKIAVIMTAKWVVIIGISILGRKLLNSNKKN